LLAAPAAAAFRGVQVVQHAREDAVSEAVGKAEDLVVPKAGIKGDLGDEIGRRIAV
jgi:ABC-type taurine transport system substrate-binding protein